MSSANQYDQRNIQTMEMVLGNIPGGSGRITKIALKAQDELGKKSLSIAEDLIGKAIPDEVVVGKSEPYKYGHY